jgi:hypothetical protein
VNDVVTDDRIVSAPHYNRSGPWMAAVLGEAGGGGNGGVTIAQNFGVPDSRTAKQIAAEAERALKNAHRNL